MPFRPYVVIKERSCFFYNIFALNRPHKGDGNSWCCIFLQKPQWLQHFGCNYGRDLQDITTFTIMRRENQQHQIISQMKLSGGCLSSEQRTGFFLAEFIKPPLRKQRTRFFSRLLRNAPLKKKANVRAATTCSSEQRKGGRKAFFHNKLAVSSSASAGFFLKAPHSNVERTILCPLFSLHPQNQSVENKTLSSLPLHIWTFAFGCRQTPLQANLAADSHGNLNSADVGFLPAGYRIGQRFCKKLLSEIT